MYSAVRCWSQSLPQAVHTVSVSQQSNSLCDYKPQSELLKTWLNFPEAEPESSWGNIFTLTDTDQRSVFVCVTHNVQVSGVIRSWSPLTGKRRRFIRALPSRCCCRRGDRDWDTHTEWGRGEGTSYCDWLVWYSKRIKQSNLSATINLTRARLLNQ